MKVLVLFSALFVSGVLNAAGFAISKTKDSFSFDNQDYNSNSFATKLVFSESHPIYLEYRQSQASDEFDFYQIGLGGLYSLSSNKHYDFGTDFYLGYLVAENDSSENEFEFTSIGIGAYFDYKVTSRFIISSWAGLQLLREITENTTCEDGSTTDSVGSGTCSSHGGIAYYNDKLGDGTAKSFSLGFKFFL